MIYAKTMYKRHLLLSAHEYIKDARVLLIHGARQVGKTTLARQLIGPEFPATYVSLDDLNTLTQAQRDPVGFIGQFTGPVIIDEVQRAPEIFLPIKVAVDTDQRPGRFVLTGSANIFTLPKLADSLAGRMELLTLWPLAQSEIEGREENFIDWLWQGEIPFRQEQGLSRADLLNRMLRGGYPAALSRATDRSRQQWFDGYVKTLLERDVRDLSKVRDLREFPRLLQAIAGRSSTLLNMQDVARSLALQHETLRRYLALLEALWLVVELPAWSTNVNSRFVKTPKVTLNDTGLMANLLNLNQARLERESVLLGQCLESFVVMELRKQLTWSQARAHQLAFQPCAHDLPRSSGIKRGNADE